MDLAWKLRGFAQIYRDFAQIFNKSKLLGGGLAPSAPPPPTPLPWAIPGYAYASQGLQHF